MKKLMVVLMLLFVSVSVFADESVLYGASGQGISSFATIDDEDGSLITYHFGSKEDGIHRMGMVTFRGDADTYPHTMVEFKYYIHGNSIQIQPTTATYYDEEGNKTGTKSGFNAYRGNYQIQTQDGETFLKLDEDLYLLID